MYVRLLYFFVLGLFVYFYFPSVLWYCWLGLLTCKTVSLITYTVLVETLNPAQSIFSLCPCWLRCRALLVTLSLGLLLLGPSPSSQPGFYCFLDAFHKFSPLTWSDHLILKALDLDLDFFSFSANIDFIHIHSIFSGLGKWFLFVFYCIFWNFAVCSAFLFLPVQSLQAKILDYSKYGRNGFYSLSKVLMEETALPGCIGTEMYWNR